MDTVSFLIKPASGRCNLRCAYCFYQDVSRQRETGDLGLLSHELLEILVKEAMATASHRVSLAFQGGEPMLRGLDFYRRLIALEQRYARPGLLIEHSIQTNGTLVTQEWAEFFRDNHFLVGISLDGNRELHNLYRKDGRGKGSWDTAVRGLKLLQRHGVAVNLLCVVTEQLARRPQAVYQSMKKLGVEHFQFIPCLDPLTEQRGGEKFSLSPEKYGRFLCTLFDLWYRDWESGHYISIRLFDDYVHLLAGQPAGTCATAGQCGRYFVLEGDGTVYPCDFFVLDEYCMGRLGESSLLELSQNAVATAFCTTGQGSPADCQDCPWLPLCHGGCRRDWVGGQRNYHCSALKSFFSYAYPRLREIARLERLAQRGHY